MMYSLRFSRDLVGSGLSFSFGVWKNTEVEKSQAFRTPPSPNLSSELEAGFQPIASSFQRFRLVA